MARSGTETEALIVTTALRLFEQHGYEATTMRKIAEEAGLSVGNAYHYFSGKDELVHELYRAVQREHAERALARLVEGAQLADNLKTVLHTGLDVMAPYHSFGGSFITHALPVASPASPFSSESTEARRMAVELMARTVECSRPSPPARVAEQLPFLLWLMYLGITVHWVSDSSSEQRDTRVLVDGAAPVVAKLVGLSRLPVARGVVDDIAALMHRLDRGHKEEQR